MTTTYFDPSDIYYSYISKHQEAITVSRLKEHTVQCLVVVIVTKVILLSNIEILLLVQTCFCLLKKRTFCYSIIYYSCYIHPYKSLMFYKVCIYWQPPGNWPQCSDTCVTRPLVVLPEYPIYCFTLH